MKRAPLEAKNAVAAGAEPRKPVYAFAPGSNENKENVPLHQASRLADEDARRMASWRKQWLTHLTSSVFYFDSVDPLFKERVVHELASYGASVQPFFDTVCVTNVVTGRNPAGALPESDVISKARKCDIKVWTSEKLLRFLRYLRTSLRDSVQSPKCLKPVSNSALPQGCPHKLSELLRVEKFLGPADRDPNTRNENFHYFRGPYILVWDPTHVHRPLLLQEYPQVSDPDKGMWPKLIVAPEGRSPFTNRPLKEKEKERHSMDKDEPSVHGLPCANKVPVAQEPARSLPTKRSASPCEAVKATKARRQYAQTAVSPKTKDVSVSVDLPASRVVSVGSCLEMRASGVAQSNITSAMSNNITNNLLRATYGLMAAPAASRELVNLQRKVLHKPAKRIEPTKVDVPDTRTKDTRPRRKPDEKLQLCENCKEQFDDLRDHCASRKHIKFANDDLNYVELDALIATIQRPLRPDYKTCA